ncbi:MAG: hypothetical protein GY853_00960 [PVC group bacterium]|nr:hypothetical protein [PVC group bacterium]
MNDYEDLKRINNELWEIEKQDFDEFWYLGFAREYIGFQLNKIEKDRETREDNDE